MRVAGRHVVHARAGETYNLYVISDPHVGNRGCAMDRLTQHVKRIADDDHAIWVGIGDYVDAIDYRDTRFDPEQLAPQVIVRDLASYGRAMRDMVVELLRPIARKCIGLGYGNHEDHFMRVHSMREWWDDFRAALGNPRDLGYCAFLDLVFSIGSKRHTFRIATHHGAGWAATPGGKLNRLRSFMESFAADIVVTGHTHERLDHRLVVLAATPSCDQLVEVPRLGVVCGSWLRTYAEGPAGYGERRGYRPVALGNPVITIQPESRRLGVEW